MLTPLTLGQELSGYVSQLNHGIKAIEHTLPHLAELALGGTAAGTGINTPPNYAENVAKHIATLTGLPSLQRKTNLRRWLHTMPSLNLTVH